MAEVISHKAPSENILSHDRVESAGEIIEERRRDSEGRVSTYKYLKGKMLGKVSFHIKFPRFDKIFYIYTQLL